MLLNTFEEKIVDGFEYSSEALEEAAWSFLNHPNPFLVPILALQAAILAYRGLRRIPTIIKHWHQSDIRKKQLFKLGKELFPALLFVPLLVLLITNPALTLFIYIAINVFEISDLAYKILKNIKKCATLTEQENIFTKQFVQENNLLKKAELQKQIEACRKQKQAIEKVNGKIIRDTIIAIAFLALVIGSFLGGPLAPACQILLFGIAAVRLTLFVAEILKKPTEEQSNIYIERPEIKTAPMSEPEKPSAPSVSLKTYNYVVNTDKTETKYLIDNTACFFKPASKPMANVNIADLPEYLPKRIAAPAA